MNNDEIIKNAQYRKGLSIAFFNATNSAVALVATRQISDREEAIKEVIRIRDFFLEEHKTYYATVIANIGQPYKAEDSIKKLKTTKTIEELKSAWLLLSEDERRNGEVKKVANEMKGKYNGE